MALADEIRATLQRIVLEVRVGGQLVPNVMEARVSHGTDQVNSQATIVFATKPALAEEGAAVEVWTGYNGYTTLVFKGEQAGKTWKYFPAGVALEARGILWRVGLKWSGDDRTYTNQDDAAIVRNILEAYGIPNTDANIESSGWTLGTIEDVVLPKGNTGLSLIEEIDWGAGYRTFVAPSGVVLRRRMSGRPGTSAIWHFQQGVDILSIERPRTLDGIVSHMVVKGLTWEDVEVLGEASATNPYLPNPPGEAADEKQSNLVETDDDANRIAQRIVGDKNRRPEELRLTVIGNPLIQAGSTIQVTSDAVDAVGVLAKVRHVEHSIGKSFTTSIITDGGNLSGYEASAPIAQFVLQLYLEAIDSGSGREPLIVGIADGSTSFDPDGTLDGLTFAWTLTPTGGSATTYGDTDGPVLRFTLEGTVTELTVDLTVTDPDSLTGSASEVKPIDLTSLTVEDLSTAEGTVIAYSEDGQQNWNEATPAGGALATNLAPIAPSWGQVWGCDDGHIYATFDGLKTDPVDFGTPHGAVAATAVWIHETDTTRLWAGFSDGRVAFGTIDTTAMTCTWELRGTVAGGAINEIRESYGTLGELRAAAGEAEYYSTDGGATWAVGLAGAGGSTAWRMAAGFDTNALALLSDTTPVRYEAGVSAPTFPSLSPAVGGTRGLSFGYRQKELYAADDQNPARLFRSDEALAAFTQIGSAAGLSQWNHLIRSGNIDGVVYGAVGDGSSGGGVVKSFRMEQPWYERRTGSRKVYMVGYGAAHLPRVVVEAGLILPTYGLSGADDGVWVHTGTTWEHRSTGGSGGLPAAGLWTGAVAHPTNDGVWMLWSASAAYLTTDAGATWTDVGISTPSGAYGGWEIGTITFTTATSNDWVAVGGGFDGGSFTVWRYFWRGVGSSVSASSASTAFEGHNSHFVNVVARLLTGAAFGHSHAWRNTNGGQTYIFSTSGATPTAIGTEIARSLWCDRLPDSPAGVGVVVTSMDGATADEGYLHYSSNAGTLTFALALATNLGASICAAADACYVGSRNAAPVGDPSTGGIIRVDGVGTSPSASIIYAAGNNVGIIRSDRQTQRTVAARRLTEVSLGVPDSSIYVYDGTTWATVAGPGSISGLNLSQWVEPATNL